MDELEMDHRLYCQIEGLFLYELDHGQFEYFDKGCVECPHCIENAD